jgi:phage tail-like protein
MARSGQADPIDKFRFLVELSPLDGVEASRAGFTTCDIPQVEFGEITYREGNYRDNVEKTPGLASYSDITLTRGVTRDQDFYTWVDKQKKFSATTRPAGDGEFGANDQRPSDDASSDFRRTVTITALDREGQPAKIWKCYNVHVSSFQAGDNLDSNAEEKLMASLTIRIETYEELPLP